MNLSDSVLTRLERVARGEKLYRVYGAGRAGEFLLSDDILAILKLKMLTTHKHKPTMGRVEEW